MNTQTTTTEGRVRMSAIVSRTYGPTESPGVEHVDRPIPGDHQILVRNHASVVTKAMCEARSGRSLMTRLYFGLRKPKWPILGTNFAGEVAAVGEAVSAFHVGDRVAGVSVTDFGGYAQYVLVPETGVITPTPAHLSDDEAVAIFDGAVTALPFLRDAARVKAGDAVLINGASGAIGTAAIQLAKHYGATVTAVCSTANLALVRSLGADAVIDRTAQEFTRARDTYDVIFDTVAKSSFSRSRDALKVGGKYLTTVPSIGILLEVLWTSRFGRKRAMIVLTGLAKPAAMAEDLKVIAELAAAQAIAPVIGATYPMEQAPAAFGHVEGGRKVGSTVISLG